MRSFLIGATATLIMILNAGHPVGQENGRSVELPYVIVLGIAQDAGFPQAGCRRACCARVWDDSTKHRQVACLAIVDPASGQRWLMECTPDFPTQLRQLDSLSASTTKVGIDGILLTHAHIGHYAGLMHLGREVMGADRIPVYAMPRMKRFLETSGPWSLLVTAKNIALRELTSRTPVQLNERISVTPILVPHRDEFSETVAFRIGGPTRWILFLPDIDKWDRWKTKIEDELSKVDIAYLDGTFYADGELPGRDMSKIPHPLISESMKRFASLPKSERGKIRFLHFNHTNPVLDVRSPQAESVRRAGYHIAEQGEQFEL